jgi:hypothetical protein
MDRVAWIEGEETMHKEDRATSIDRRSFLKKAGLTAGTVGAVAVATAAEAAVSSEDAAPGGDGYRETEHVRTYYELARF